jgi:hypothetical protein
MVRVLLGLDLRVTALEGLGIKCTDKLNTRPLVREGAPKKKSSKCLKIFPMEVKEKLVAVDFAGS